MLEIEMDLICFVVLKSTVDKMMEEMFFAKSQGITPDAISEKIIIRL